MTDPARSETGDVITGCLLLLLSLCGIVYSISLERPSGWNTAPGLLPLIISTLMFAMALIMVVGSARGNDRASPHPHLPAGGSTGAVNRFRSIHPTLMAMVVVALFYFVLLVFLWFEVAAFGFLYAMTHLFWRDSTFRSRLVFSAVTPFLFVLVFQLSFSFSLPGAGTLTEFVLFALR